MFWKCSDECVETTDRKCSLTGFHIYFNKMCSRTISTKAGWQIRICWGWKSYYPLHNHDWNLLDYYIFEEVINKSWHRVALLRTRKETFANTNSDALTITWNHISLRIEAVNAAEGVNMVRTLRSTISLNECVKWLDPNCTL